MQSRHSRARTSYLQYGMQKAQLSALSQVRRPLSSIVRLISIEVTTKDTGDGWKAYIAGSKEWSIDTDGLYINTDASMQALSTAFENGDPVCIKVYNKKAKKSMFGGLAVITDFPLEAPYDDSMTYSISLKGQGKLVDLSANPVTPDTLPA